MATHHLSTTHPDAGPDDAGPVRGAMTPDDARHIARVERAIRTRSFAMLATTSPAGFPHAAGVVYASVGTTLYVHTMRSSRKARNIDHDDRVAVVVPVRKLPVGPPFAVQFQGRATVMAMDDPQLAELLAGRRLAAITGHGALDEPDGCFVRIVPTGRIHTYGIGVSALAVARDPLHVGERTVDIGVRQVS